MEGSREEGELTDEEDVIITQVTCAGRKKRSNGLHQIAKSPIKPIDLSQDKKQNAASLGSDTVPKLSNKENNKLCVFEHNSVFNAKSSNRCTETQTPKGTQIHTPTTVPIVISNSPISSNTNASSTSANAFIIDLCSPDRIKSSQTGNASSGFIDKMRARTTSLTSSSNTSLITVHDPPATTNVTIHTSDIDLTSIPTPPLPKPISRQETATEVIHLASIPTPAPPPLPNTPPPSVPLPPPGDPSEEHCIQHYIELFDVLVC